MSTPPTCPRCAGALDPPGLWSSAWRCDRHGAVHPFHLAPVPTAAALTKLVADAAVPVWLPCPLPRGWLVTGLGGAGDERTGLRAALVALSGPAPSGGPGDLAVVAEEPGVGLGARFAGLAATDPGGVPDTAPEARVEAAGHDTALWRTAAGEDRGVLVGEAKGLWLWLVGWPEDTVSALDGAVLHDLRDGEHASAELVFGALSPRWSAANTA